LGKLQSSVAAQRRTAITAAVGLPAEEQAPLYEALLDRAVRRPESDAMKTLVELTARLPVNWPKLIAALGKVAPNNIPPALPLELLTLGRDQPGVGSLIDQWAASDNTALKKAIASARKSPV
jgi:hypothetical protein